MRTGDVILDTPDGAMRSYEAVPDGAAAAVIVIQEAFGVNPHIEDVTPEEMERRMAAMAG